MNSRAIERLIPAVRASDGAGVRLVRSLGQGPHSRLDPFLMLDEFGSDQPADYEGGFPPHPHRGFETVTYMLAGRMRHRDHMNNTGLIGPGDVQWMTAGRGIIHEEMPEQDDGRMHGFQLWINLPAAEKMKPAAYHDIEAGRIPRVSLPGGGSVRVIAGSAEIHGRPVEGPISGWSTDPLYFDLELEPGEVLDLPVDDARNAAVYVFRGGLAILGQTVESQNLAVFGKGDRVSLAAGEQGARALLLAGRPLGEPVAQWGPFVMNTREEVEQAMSEYRDGTLSGEAPPRQAM